MMKQATAAMMLLIILSLSGCGLLLGGGQYSQSQAEWEFSQLLTESRSQVSPSGKYLMTLERGEDAEDPSSTFVLYTNDAAREKVYESDHRVLPYFTAFILWDEDADRVWMYDGDTGIYFAEEIDGVWRRYSRWLDEGQYYWFDDTDPDEVYISRTNGEIDHWPQEYAGEVEIPELLIKLRPYLGKEPEPTDTSGEIS